MNLNKEELRSAVIGMVLGDGCLSKQWKKGNANFQLSHCEKQYDYVLWKQSILEKITKTSICSTRKEMNGKVFIGYHLTTHRHPFFTKLYNRFYHSGKKAVDEYLVKKVNDLALAIWFMDDGTVGIRHLVKGDVPSFILCTQSFDYANQLLIKKSFKLNFGLDWNLNKAEKSRDGSYNYRMRLAWRHNDKFIDIIKPYIIPSMQYKLSSYANISDKDIDTV